MRQLFFVILSLLPLSIAHSKNYFSDVQVNYYDRFDNKIELLLSEKSRITYPAFLAKEGFKGCAIFESRIISGRAENLMLISTRSGPALVSEAQKMIRSWAFGATSAPQPVKIKVNFCLGGRSAEQIQNFCIRQAQMQC